MLKFSFRVDTYLVCSSFKFVSDRFCLVCSDFALCKIFSSVAEIVAIIVLVCFLLFLSLWDVKGVCVIDRFHFVRQYFILLNTLR